MCEVHPVRKCGPAVAVTSPLRFIQPCSPVTAKSVPAGYDWQHEVKFDYRLVGDGGPCQLSSMSDKAHSAPGRIIRVTPKNSGGVFPTRKLFAVAVGDDQQALSHFKDAYPELDAVIEVVGELSEYSLQDLGLKPGRLVPL